MRRTGVMIAAATVLCAASGCGTMLSLDLSPCVPNEKGNRQALPFGGVANDVTWIRTADQPINVAFSLVDIPFSLIGDVVTLPWTVHSTLASAPQERRLDDEWRRFWMEPTSREKMTDLDGAGDHSAR